MQAGDWFVLIVAVLQACAAGSYFWKRRWLEGAVWLSYGFATAAVLVLTMRGRPTP